MEFETFEYDTVRGKLFIYLFTYIVKPQRDLVIEIHVLSYVSAFILPLL